MCWWCFPIWKACSFTSLAAQKTVSNASSGFCLCPVRMFNKSLIKMKFLITKPCVCYLEAVTGGVLSLGNWMLFPRQLRAGTGSPSSVVPAVLLAPLPPWFGGRNLRPRSRNPVHLLVVGDPRACWIIVNWEANRRDSELRLCRSAGASAVSQRSLWRGLWVPPLPCPDPALSLRFPPLASCFRHHRLLFTPQLLALHTTGETADPTSRHAREIDPRFVRRELNETFRSGPE